jgi:outer membrane protein insertion porin family
LVVGRHADARPQGGSSDEQERPEVVDVRIEGARHVDEAVLRAGLETRASPWGPWRAKIYFDPSVFAEDLKRLEAVYAARGYPQAEIEGIVDRLDGNRVALRVIVREGAPVLAEDVVFVGFSVLSQESVDALRDAASLQPGRPVGTDVVQETTRQAITTLWNAGYAYANVEILGTEIAPDRVRVEVRAEPGLQTVFGSIDLAGHVSVEDAVIRRELTYLPGEVFRATPIEESQRRLAGLGLFDSVEIEVLEREPSVVGAPTRVRVTEGDHTQFTYSFGYGSDTQGYGEGGWRHLNFLGGARTAWLRGRWSWLDRGVEGVFVEPYVFTRGMSLILRGYAWHVDEAPYTAFSRGGRAGVQLDVGRSVLTATYLHEFESIRVAADAGSDPRAPLALLGLDVESGRQSGVRAALQIGLTRDASTEVGGMARGYRAALQLEQAGGWLPGAFNYVSVQGDGRYYQPLSGVVLAGWVRYGSIAPFGPPSDVPFSARYFLGGAQSLRGWGRFEVSPLAASGLPIGGQSFFTVSGELRVPVAGPVGTVVFADMGNAWEATWTLSSDLRADAGVGLRYASRLGLLRLDFASQLTTLEGLRLNSERRDRSWRIQFGIGHTF